MNFLLLQINDSAFPIGSYTQSFGLESYVQHNLITNANEAWKYLRALLQSQMLYTDLLSIKLIYESQSLNDILHIEAIMNAAMPARETREGVQKLGARFIKAVQSMELELPPLFRQYASQSCYPAHSSAYALFCKSMDIPYHESMRTYMYAQTANALTNCVKLIPLSQYDGQAILSRLHGEFERIEQVLQDLGMEDFCAASVHNDMQAMLHENLHSRLYMS